MTFQDRTANRRFQTYQPQSREQKLFSEVVQYARNTDSDIAWGWSDDGTLFCSIDTVNWQYRFEECQ